MNFDSLFVSSGSRNFPPPVLFFRVAIRREIAGCDALSRSRFASKSRPSGQVSPIVNQDALYKAPLLSPENFR